MVASATAASEPVAAMELLLAGQRPIDDRGSTVPLHSVVGAMGHPPGGSLYTREIAVPTPACHVVSQCARDYRAPAWSCLPCLVRIVMILRAARPEALAKTLTGSAGTSRSLPEPWCFLLKRYGSRSAFYSAKLDSSSRGFELSYDGGSSWMVPSALSNLETHESVEECKKV